MTLKSFVRDRFTWLAYLFLATFAYLQVTPGIIVSYLHKELHLTYMQDSLHMSALAFGLVLVGLLGDYVARYVSRRTILWIGATGLVSGSILLILSHNSFFSISSMLIIGISGSLFMVMLQAALSDHHGSQRAVAISEANTLASVAVGLTPIALVGATAVGLGWRGMLFVPVLAVGLLALFFFSTPVPQAQSAVVMAQSGRHLRFPRSFWLYLVVLVLGVAIEWCMNFWGSGYLINVVGLPAQTASTLMSVYFLLEILSRIAGTQYARRVQLEKLIPIILSIVLVGFLLFWALPWTLVRILGLFIVGIGIANMFPFSFSVVIAQVPYAAGAASARCTLGGGMAILICPLVLGRVADMVGLQMAAGLVVVLIALAGGAIFVAGRSERPDYEVSISYETAEQANEKNPALV